MLNIKVELGVRIQTGGCVGKITHITSTEITVSGVYRYLSDDSRENYYESWTNIYRREDLEKITIWHQFTDGTIIWDATNTNSN